MDIKKIINLCKQNKSFGSIIDDDGLQWLGDGWSFYQLPKDTPFLAAENISALYGIDKEKMNNEYLFKELDVDEYLTSDICEDEEQLREIYIKVNFKGMELMPFASRNGLILIDTKYLKPLNLKDYEMYFMLRKDKVVIKEGMFVIAYITPFDLNTNEEFTKQLSELYKQNSISRENEFLKNKNFDEMEGVNDVCPN